MPAVRAANGGLSPRRLPSLSAGCPGAAQLLLFVPIELVVRTANHHHGGICPGPLRGGVSGMPAGANHRLLPTCLLSAGTVLPARPLWSTGMLDVRPKSLMRIGEAGCDVARVARFLRRSARQDVSRPQ